MRNLAANLRDLAHAAAGELLAHLTREATVTDPAPATCAVPGCHRRALGGRLCRYGELGRRGTSSYIEDGGHFEELGRWLRDIQTEAQRLALDTDNPEAWTALPSMSTRWDTTGGSPLASQRAPVVLDVLAHTDPRSSAHGYLHIGPVCRRCPSLLARPCTCPPLPWRRADHYAGCPREGMHSSCLDILLDRDEHGAERPLYTLGVLHDLAERVREERILTRPMQHVVDRMPGVQWPGPVCPVPCVHDTCQSMAWWRTIPVPPTIAGERDLLTRNLDWIAAQPWVLAAREQLGELRTQLMRINRNADDRPLTGWCYKAVDDQGTECGGSLWPVYVAHTSGDGDEHEGPLQPREVVCERNPAHRWKGGKGGDLARLSMYLEQQRGVTRSAADSDKPRRPEVAPSPGTVTVQLGGIGDRLRPVLEQQHREDPAS